VKYLSLKWRFVFIGILLCISYFLLLRLSASDCAHHINALNNIDQDYRICYDLMEEFNHVREIRIVASEIGLDRVLNLADQRKGSFNKKLEYALSYKWEHVYNLLIDVKMHFDDYFPLMKDLAILSAESGQKLNIDSTINARNDKKLPTLIRKINSLENNIREKLHQAMLAQGSTFSTIVTHQLDSMRFDNIKYGAISLLLAAFISVFLIYIYNRLIQSKDQISDVLEDMKSGYLNKPWSWENIASDEMGQIILKLHKMRKGLSKLILDNNDNAAKSLNEDIAKNKKQLAAVLDRVSLLSQLESGIKEKTDALTSATNTINQLQTENRGLIDELGPIKSTLSELQSAQPSLEQRAATGDQVQSVAGGIITEIGYINKLLEDVDQYLFVEEQTSIQQGMRNHLESMLKHLGQVMSVDCNAILGGYVIDINTLLQNIIERLGLCIPYALTVQTYYHSKLWPVSGNSRILTDILFSLLTSFWKAGIFHHELHIETKNVHVNEVFQAHMPEIMVGDYIKIHFALMQGEHKDIMDNEKYVAIKGLINGYGGNIYWHHLDENKLIFDIYLPKQDSKHISEELVVDDEH